MANLRRPYSKDKDNMVGRFNPNGGRCNKHLKHVQSTGVCSLCLKDKLDQILASSSSTSYANVDSLSCSSTSSSLSSSSASSCSSPMHETFYTGGSSDVSIFLFHKHGGLVKSKSMAVFPRRRKSNDDDLSKKKGFWFKLFHPNYKNKIRTRSVREL